LAFTFMGASSTDTTNGTGTTDLRDNEWHHVVIVRDNSNAKAYGYIDGKLQIDVTDNADGSFNGADTSVYLGQWNVDGTNRRFSGSIDDVKIYNYARTQAQIAYDFNRGGPTSHWKFDECQGTEVYSSGTNTLVSFSETNLQIGASGSNTAVGNCTSGTSTDMWYNGANGKLNASLDLDGTDDYANPWFSTAPLPNSSDYSIATWVKADSSGSGGTIYSQQNGSSAVLVAFLLTGSTFVHQFHNGTDWQTATASRDIVDGQWHHIAATFTSNTITLYIDGVLVQTAATSGALTGSAIPTIGAHYAAATRTNYFNGQIDDLRIYNYALSAAQIRNIMQDSAAFRFGPTEGQP
jgi:hypothetical protein